MSNSAHRMRRKRGHDAGDHFECTLACPQARAWNANDDKMRVLAVEVLILEEMGIDAAAVVPDYATVKAYRFRPDNAEAGVGTALDFLGWFWIPDEFWREANVNYGEAEQTFKRLRNARIEALGNPLGHRVLE